MTVAQVRSALPFSVSAVLYFGKRRHLSATNKSKISCKEPDGCKLLPIITYEKISKKPQVANELIGMSLEEFEKLYAEFETIHIERMRALQYTRRNNLKRRRAVGAGRKHKYALRDRLLMTLFWLRAYTTYKVLGTFYDLNKTTVEDYLKNVMDTLSTLASFKFESPQADVPKLSYVEEVINAFPDVLLIANAEEHSANE